MKELDYFLVLIVVTISSVSSVSFDLCPREENLPALSAESFELSNRSSKTSIQFRLVLIPST